MNQKKHTIITRLLGFLRLIRWPNLLIITLSQLLVRIFLIPTTTSYFDVAFFKILISTLLIAASGYIINDYFDVKIDLVNKPKRVVIGRLIRRRKAITIHHVFNILGCMIGLWTSKWIFVVNVLSVSFLWLYSAYFKKQPLIGNILVSLLTALSLGVLGIYYQQNTNLILTYSVFAFGISLIREIIKDIEDLRGDIRHCCRTLPIVWGIRRTKTLLFVLIFLFVCFLLNTTVSSPKMYLQLNFAVLVLGMLGLSHQLYWADTRRAFWLLSQYCKIIMLVGMLSMVFF